MAPSYACLGMGLFEEEMKDVIPDQPLVWKRYIDDIWGLWDKGKEAFLSFIEHLNGMYPNELQFTYEFSDSLVTYLDLQIAIKEGFIHTDLYTKPSCKDPLYLHYSSFHKKSVKDNIPYCQTLRIRSICSNETECGEHLKTLETNLTKRGYPPNVVKEKITIGKTKPRDALLLQNKVIGNKNTAPKAPFVVTRIVLVCLLYNKLSTPISIFFPFPKKCPAS